MGFLCLDGIRLAAEALSEQHDIQIKEDERTNFIPCTSTEGTSSLYDYFFKSTRKGPENAGKLTILSYNSLRVFKIH